MKTEKGFALVEGLLILVIVGMLGGLGWYVWNTNKNTNESLTSADTVANSSAAKYSKKPTSPTFNKLPNGWTEYKNDEKGLRLGYPKVWGALAFRQEFQQLVTPAYQNDGQNLEGSLTVKFSAKNGFSIVAQKYGATIKPSDDGKSWIVANENPSSIDNYKAGDTYNTKEEKINGGVAIDLSYGDEGCSVARWLAELKNSYLEISLPSLCSSNFQPVSSSNQAAYTKLRSDFLSTVTIY